MYQLDDLLQPYNKANNFTLSYFKNHTYVITYILT
jgi:hypothetical protein